jgi:hypothetical protein
MSDTDGVFPDDVPVTDAVEQQRPTADFPPDPEDAVAARPEDDLPLEASASDWQAQREEVLTDPEYDEF